MDRPLAIFAIGLSLKFARDSEKLLTLLQKKATEVRMLTGGIFSQQDRQMTKLIDHALRNADKAMGRERKWNKTGKRRITPRRHVDHNPIRTQLFSEIPHHATIAPYRPRTQPHRQRDHGKTPRTNPSGVGSFSMRSTELPPDSTRKATTRGQS
uniref:Uncharacterized protein n=1 Tax=Candidatus Kentrum eta TaxID=2126337 RepID=A0A450VFL3_9GAMM|nr:MAG: hypothetical protein BECKH772B_GA0070898_103624 [Candidatus Kentron sp. H]VFK03886.1 MAG: hypothetical protein BECKH772A_GA0070896_103624 [Candidatus Kentron sp. H]VFK06565.1 MAG: hypothetical protein BECKH772C_GA0070978_103584 [Candidatus Kentron sp. H]